ncbi:hypothetical protein AB1Y20_004439 [Prymnesium parvum]|uniref:Neurotransmitter-gated ion-channel transmembrane domain-containing protein n=1 Tax=Prymnesium parvum TaxID=97485 RepID=A0AB34IY33_PRYPA
MANRRGSCSAQAPCKLRAAQQADSSHSRSSRSSRTASPHPGRNASPHPAGRIASDPADAARTASPVRESKKETRRRSIPIQVLRVNLLQLQYIDITSQVFSARYLLQLRIPDGANDADLMRDFYDNEPVFPQDTLRPGARWFMEQIEFPTALSLVFNGKKVVQMGRHLDIVVKVTGTFFEHMELHNFPFDIQRITTVVSFACAEEGIVPVHFVEESLATAASAVGTDTFALSNMWKLYPGMNLSVKQLRPMPGTTYPSLSFAALVIRKPSYFIANTVIPLSTLTFLALLQFLLPGARADQAATTRITYSVTILLTSATYKLFVADHLPAISYLSVLDRYALACYMLQVGMVAQGALLGALITSTDEPSWPTDDADIICGAVFLVLYCAVHIYYPWVAITSRQRDLTAERLIFGRGKEIPADTYCHYRETTSQVSGIITNAELAV